MYYPTDDQKIQALDSLITSGDKEGYTVGEYFHELLKQLWIQEEGFSGKRPFGNSGWKQDLMCSLVTCAYVPGKIIYSEYDPIYPCSDVYIEDIVYDRKQADKLVLDLVEFIFDRV